MRSNSPLLYYKPVDNLILLPPALPLYPFYHCVLIGLADPMGMPKLAKGGCYNTSISYKITLCSIDSCLADINLFNNKLRAPAKEKQTGDINLLKGKKKMLIYALSAREWLCSHCC